MRPAPRQGWTYARIATALGISVRTVAKWVARARQAALTDASSRPHRQPRRLAARVEAAIVALRRTRATAWQISTALRIPRSTVTRVLARVGLNRVALLEPAPVARRTAALRPYLRSYNHRRPHTSLGRRSPWMRFQEAI